MARHAGQRLEPDVALVAVAHSLALRVIAKNGSVGFCGGRAAAEVLGFTVMFLRLGEMLIDAGEVFAMPFLRMVSDQNWLTERDRFEPLAGGEMPPG